MKTLKNRIVIAVALVMMLVGTVVPAMAEDTTATDTSEPISFSVQLSASGFVSMMTVPVRCGNNC